MTSCACRTLLGGVVYRDDCPIHTTIPESIPCARCPEPIGGREPRIPVAGPDGSKVPVHVACADVRERLGLTDTVTSPMMRAEEARQTPRRRVDGKVPLFMQPGRMARLRRRR